MMMHEYMYMYMFFMGVLSFTLNRKHLLTMLLSMEFMVLMLFMSMMFFFSFYSYEYYFSMIFLTMSVCESALGLSLLVAMIRSHGSDYFLNFNLLW